MSNKKTQLALLVAAVAVLLPSTSLAVVRPTGERSVGTTQPAPTPKQNLFCSTLAQKERTVTDRITKSDEQLSQLQTDRMAKLQERQKNRTDSLDSHRLDSDGFKAASFVALEKNAKNDAQLQAIKAFEASVNSAVSARNAAISAAIKDYQTGIQSILQSRQTALKTAQTNFSKAVSTAFDQATADCSAGKDSATVQTAFNQALKAAKDQFNKDRQAVDKLGPQVSALEKTRNTAIQKALKDFKAAMQKAKDTLKAALKAAAPTPTPTATPTPTPTPTGE